MRAGACFLNRRAIGQVRRGGAPRNHHHIVMSMRIALALLQDRIALSAWHYYKIALPSLQYRIGLIADTPLARL